jgi:hypothetical protein
MTQLFANVSLANTFNTWLVRSNQLVDYVNRSANSTGVSNITSSNATFTNVVRLSGPISISGNATITSSNTYITSNVTFGSTGAIKLPVGTTAQRGAHNSPGHFRYNSSTSVFEGYVLSTGWIAFPSKSSLTSGYVTNTVFQSALANTNSFVLTRTANTVFKTVLANTNAYIAKKYAVANVEAKFVSNTYAQATFVSNTYAQATFSTTTDALSKSSASEQTIQPSVVVANTFIAQKGAPIKTVSSNTYTLILTDNGKYIRMSNTGGITITIPTNATVTFPVGAEFIIVHTGGNTSMTFANAAGVTLNSIGGSKVVNYQFSPATLKKVGTNEFDLAGV